MFQWIAQSWFSCKKYMERLSRSLDERLSMREWLGYIVHHYCCRRCRVARTHIIQLNTSLDSLSNQLRGSGDLVEAEDFWVSPEFIAQVKQRVLLEKKGK